MRNRISIAFIYLLLFQLTDIASYTVIYRASQVALMVKNLPGYEWLQFKLKICSGDWRRMRMRAWPWHYLMEVLLPASLLSLRCCSCGDPRFPEVSLQKATPSRDCYLPGTLLQESSPSSRNFIENAFLLLLCNTFLVSCIRFLHWVCTT